MAFRIGAASLLAVALHSASRAESTLQTAASGTGAVSAPAHLDFRVTVLPSLGLSLQPGGVRIQANSGVLTLQRDARSAWDGRAPTGSLQLRPRHQVTDTSMQASAFAGGELVTIASP
jgi:hypothetical protein